MPRPRSICLFSILLFLSTVAVSSPFYGPSIDGDTQPGTTFNITVNTTEQLTNPILRYKAIDAFQWNDCQLQDGSCELGPLDEGIYSYYLINATDETTRLPANGSFRFVVTEERTAYYSTAEQLSKTDPTNQNFGDSCQPWSDDFSCGLEPHQAAMITAFSDAYQHTGNQTIRAKLKNTSITQYDSTNHRWATCDRADDDYNCENRTGDETEEISPPTSPYRQASLTQSLTGAGLTLDSTMITDEGATYADGSAQNCDIWSGDYDCLYPDDQGRMINAMWQTYTATGNETYRDHATALMEELLTMTGQIDTDDFPAVQALFRTGRMTDNQTYYQIAAEQLDPMAAECINETGPTNCSVPTYTDAIDTFIEGYQATGDSYYYHLAEETLTTSLNATCSPTDDEYACINALNQGSLAQSYWNGYENLPTVETQLSRPYVTGNRSLGTEKTFHISIEGNPDQLTAEVRRFGASSWTSCQIDRRTGNCTIDGDTFQQQTSYEYRFNTGSMTFPDQRQTFIVGLTNETIQSHAWNITEAETATCGPWTEGYSCENTHYQAEYIDAMNTVYRLTDNSSFREYSLNFATAPYDPTDETRISICDHNINDFDCQATRTPNGSVRQGKIIEALWETYTLTGNQTVRELAYNYTHGTPNDCDPWSGDHSCGSERGQGAMIDGMRAAYLATGNTTYRDQASSLVSAATSSPSDPELTTALWDVAGTTANTDAETAVNTTTNDTLHTCISDDCDPYPYAQTFETSMTAFSETDNETYHDTGYDLLDTGTNRTCDIWNQSYQCDDPDQQASMITAAWQGFSYFFSNLNGDITLDVTSSSLNPGDSTDLVCDVENVVADGADLVNVNITLETDSLTIEGNSSKEIDTIAPLTSANLTSSVSADSAGEYTITCNAESDGGWGDVTSTTISVEEEDTGGGGNGGSGSGGGGSGPITPPEPDPTILNETYDFSHQAGSGLADQLDQHPQLRDSLGAILDTRDPMVSRTYTASRDQCLSGVRRYRGLDEGYKNTTLTLRYSCTDFLEEIMIFDTIPQQYSSYDDFSRETEEMEQLVLSTNPTQIAYTRKNITEGTDINITYRTQANGSFEFDPPIVVMKNHSLPAPETPPPPTIMMPDLIRNISSSYQPLSIETSNANQCSLDINDQTIERNFQPPYTYNSSFDVGWNTVTVLCEGEEEQQAIETYRVYRQPEQPVDRGTPVPLVPILGLLTVLLAAGGIYRYRGDIITPVRERIRKKQLQDQLDQMQEEFDQDNFDKVIEHYNKAKDLYTKLHGQPPSMSFWNQFFGELGMAMRVYLLLDLSEAQLKKGNTEKVLNTLSNLQRLYNRMKTDSSIENTDKVTKKARAFNRELRKHGEQFDV